MSLDPSLKSDFTATLFVAKPTGAVGVGGTSYAAPVETLARIEPKRSIVDAADGTRRATTHWIATDGEIVGAPGTFVKIEDHDRLWFFGADETKPGEARLPARVDEAKDEDDNFEHVEIRV